MIAAPQTAAALINALTNIRVIKSKLAATGGALTNTVFSTQGPIPDTKLDNARGAIGLEFASLVQNVRAIKTTDPICKAHPGIHYKLKDQVARRNWLVREYGTTAPIRWGEVADSIYNDVPRIESEIITVLKEQGIIDP